MAIRRTLVLALLGTAAAAQVAGAQTATFYDSRAAFLAALGAASVQTQDFSGYAPGTDLAGVAVIPGLVAQSPFATLEARMSGSDIRMFGSDMTTRQAGGGYYDLINTGGFSAIGFDIDSWDPATSGANVVISFSSGGPITHNLIATNATEQIPVFFGVITSTAFTSLRLNEPFEVGIAGNEEVAIDDIAVAAPAIAPEPSTVLLVATGLLAAGVVTRRRRSPG